MKLLNVILLNCRIIKNPEYLSYFLFSLNASNRKHVMAAAAQKSEDIVYVQIDS